MENEQLTLFQEVRFVKSVIKLPSCYKAFSFCSAPDCSKCVRVHGDLERFRKERMEVS